MTSMDGSEDKRKKTQLNAEQGLSVVTVEKSQAKSSKSKASAASSQMSEGTRRRRQGPQNERTIKYLGLNKKKKKNKYSQ